MLHGRCIFVDPPARAPESILIGSICDGQRRRQAAFFGQIRIYLYKLLVQLHFGAQP